MPFTVADSKRLPLSQPSVLDAEFNSTAFISLASLLSSGIDVSLEYETMSAAAEDTIGAAKLVPETLPRLPSCLTVYTVPGADMSTALTTPFAVSPVMGL